MSALESIIERLADAARHPGRTVAEQMSKTGKKAVGCFPIYTPEEIVYAAGALPVGMWGGSVQGTLADRYLPPFCCSVIRANTEQALEGRYDRLSAVIVTAFCDTLKCTIENWKTSVPHLNILPIVYPQNRKSAAGKRFMEEEFRRLKKLLERTLEVDISESALEESYSLYEEYRKTMRYFVKEMSEHPAIFDPVTRHLLIKAAYFMDKKEYTELVRQLLAELRTELKQKREGTEWQYGAKNNNKKLVLTGLLAEPVDFLELFTENDFTVVADDLAQESRQFRTEGPETGPVLDRMAERVARQDGCSFLYDSEKTRGNNLLSLVKEHGADGVVVCQMKFCDPEEFDYPDIKETLDEAGIPTLYLEIEQQMNSVEQLRTRVQSFRERLGTFR